MIRVPRSRRSPCFMLVPARICWGQWWGVGGQWSARVGPGGANLVRRGIGFWRGDQSNRRRAWDSGGGPGGGAGGGGLGRAVPGRGRGRGGGAGHGNRTGFRFFVFPGGGGAAGADRLVFRGGRRWNWRSIRVARAARRPSSLR